MNARMRGHCGMPARFGGVGFYCHGRPALPALPVAFLKTALAEPRTKSKKRISNEEQQANPPIGNRSSQSPLRIVRQDGRTSTLQSGTKTTSSDFPDARANTDHHRGPVTIQTSFADEDNRFDSPLEHEMRFVWQVGQLRVDRPETADSQAWGTRRRSR